MLRNSTNKWLQQNFNNMSLVCSRLAKPFLLHLSVIRQGSKKVAELLVTHAKWFTKLRIPDWQTGEDVRHELFSHSVGQSVSLCINLRSRDDTFEAFSRCPTYCVHPFPSTMTCRNSKRISEKAKSLHGLRLGPQGGETSVLSMFQQILPQLSACWTFWLVKH